MNTITTVKEAYLQKMMNGNRSKATLRTYRNQIEGFNRFIQKKYNLPLDIADITTEDVEEYIHELRDCHKWKTNSVNLVISTLKGFFRYAIKKQFIAKDIMDDIEQLRKIKVERDFLTEDEMSKLIEAIKQPLIKLLVKTLAYTGLRISEALNLTLNDVDFEKKIIQVINGKGGKNRNVPIPVALANELMIYKDTKRPSVETPYFFALAKTGSVSQQYVNRELKIATKKAGIHKNVSAHILRHSYASALVRKGTSLPIVAKLLGHSDFRTVTSIYVHLEDDELTSAVNQLHIPEHTVLQ